MIVQQEDHKDSFYKSFKPVLILGQICGLIPLRGILGPHHTRLRCTWRNPVHLYSIIIFAVAFFFAYAQFKEIIKIEIKLDRIAGVVFYATVLITIIMFFNLARKFPEVANDFFEVEKHMGGYGYPKHMRLKILIFIIVATVLAVVEHGTMAVMIVNRAERMAYFDHVSFGYAYFLCAFREVSLIAPYNPFATIVMFWVNVICTLSWNYIDFFLIAIFMEVSSKLNQINKKIATFDLTKKNQLLWRKVLEDYNRMSKLVKKLDNYLSSIIIISLMNDLYHLSLQLLRSLKIEGSAFQKCYFYFSMFFLMGRLLGVSFCAAQIDEESRSSLDLLYCIKEPCQESNRLLEQIVTDDIYFTGKKFFILNRTFMLTLIGTLMTYQVILLQVNSLNYYSDKK